MHAPLVIFAFNRPKALKRTLGALEHAMDSKETDLYIYIDGARANKAGEQQLVDETCEVAKGAKGFKSVTIKLSENNKGLAKSIISGATEVINKHGRVIVLEDDLVPQANFLAYMNQMLDRFADEKKVFQVSGYGPRIMRPRHFKNDAYFHYRAQSWSWATWKDRWDTVDWEVKTFDALSQSPEQQKAFNRGGSDLYGMLKGYMEGRNNSWYVRFTYEMHRQGKLCVLPVNSLISNEGFNEAGTHCHGYNRYKVTLCDPAKEQFAISSDIAPDESLSRQVVFYWSIPYRIYGKLMNYAYKALGK